MVSVRLPPPDPKRRLAPVPYPLRAGTPLVRIYDPGSPYRPGPLAFREAGPFARWDHQLDPRSPRTPRRAIWYGGLTFACAVVEAFDIGAIDPGTKHVARPT